MDNAPKRKVKERTQLNINLKVIRENKGFTQKEVAGILKMPDNRMINWYENTGAMPPYEKLVALAELYNVSLDELFGITNHTNIMKGYKKDSKKLLYDHNNNSIITTKIDKKLRGFYVTGESLTKKRVDTLKTLIENPTLLDSIADLLNHK